MALGLRIGGSSPDVSRMNPPSEISQRKARLRAATRARLQAIPADDWRRQSAAVCDRIRSLPEWNSARWLGGYVPMRDELDLVPLMREALTSGRRVAVPAFDAISGGYTFHEVRDWDRDLVSGKYGIGEPSDACPSVPVTCLDFVLVPGVAFDRFGRRLGRGKGFYDRLLALAVGVTCGVGGDEQLLPDVPVEAHDIRLNLLAVPGGLYGSRATR